MSNSTPTPSSCTNYAVNIFSCFLFFFTFFFLRSSFAIANLAYLPICAFVAFTPLMLVDIAQGKKFFGNQGITYSLKREFSFKRLTLKLIGLALTYGFLFFIYWLLPVYKMDFYNIFFSKVYSFIWYLVILSVPYFALVDLMMKDPEDSYYELGKVALFRFKGIDKRLIREHFKAWLVKGFFFPLMCGYFYNDMGRLYNFDFNAVNGFHQWFSQTYDFLFTIDLLFAAIGYVMTFKIFNSQIYSAEPTVLGWFICLICYDPFWGDLLYNKYFAYDDSIYWGNLLVNLPTLYYIWGSMIICCLIIYASATIAFGYRFSNLTYRGLISNGPYSFTKHPAYVFKNLSWWLVSVPFIYESSPLEAVRNCILLFGVNTIYYLRARTEENHLSNYPEYVAYAEMMNKKSIFAPLAKVLPFLKYSKERAHATNSKIYKPFTGRTDL